jgi:hypothetical protein
MTRILQIELSAEHAAALDTIAAATVRSPDIVARDWLVERLIAHGTAGMARRDDAVTSEWASATEQLRARYRPDDVKVLLVGESAPAGGTFFYQADSNLFHATREAFVRAMGPMPDAERFLEKFKDLGFWLYDMAEGSINRKPGRPRRDAVSAGVGALSHVMRELEPEFVIGIKTSLEGPIKAAAALAAYGAQRIVVLPFPLYQWRERYVADLGRFLDRDRAGIDEDDASPAEGLLTLHAAMTQVLQGAGGGPIPAREIANEIASRSLYVRRDGTRADYQQVRLRAIKYPMLFESTTAGIRLRPGG